MHTGTLILLNLFAAILNGWLWATSGGEWTAFCCGMSSGCTLWLVCDYIKESNARTDG